MRQCPSVEAPPAVTTDAVARAWCDTDYDLTPDRARLPIELYTIPPTRNRELEGSAVCRLRGAEWRLGL